MDNQKQQAIERIQQANNILVTVNSNPSVDQLSACIGVTIALNKLGKHATAVFSGAIPSTIEFLQPEQTLEKTTDSLRDFIIALDKSKADKLRYKVEDRMVKIFITPYRTSITDKDLEFSQGDFNVDVVLALGVHNQQDLDQAITAHGRILHDATVMSVNVQSGGELGSVNWIDAGASSLSELGVQLIDQLDKKLMDGQIATALLTGIIAETERFSNQKTSPQTMSISAELMAAGANQQLVSTKLQEPVVIPEPPKPKEEKNPIGEAQKPSEKPAEPPKPDDGTIEIEHNPTDIPKANEEPLTEKPEAPQIHIDEQGRLHPFGPSKPDANDKLPKIRPLPDIRHDKDSKLLTTPQPPTLGNSPLTANIVPESENEPSTDPLSLPSVGLLNREPLPSQKPDEPAPTPNFPELSKGAPVAMPEPPKPSEKPTPADDMPHLANPGVTPVPPPVPAQDNARTLSDIEKDVLSPHLQPPTSTGPSQTAAPSFVAPPPASQPPMPPQPPMPQPFSFEPPQPPARGPVPPAVPSFSPPAPLAPPNPGPELGPVPPAPVESNPAQNVDDARNAVEAALKSSTDPNPEPIQALNAQPLGNQISHDAPVLPPAPPTMDVPGVPNLPQPTPPPASQPPMPPQPPMPQPFSFEPPQPPATPMPNNPGGTPPPPVPPPMMPPSFPNNP